MTEFIEIFMVLTTGVLVGMGLMMFIVKTGICNLNAKEMVRYEE